MRALTILQPWADAIVHGWKPVENRSWPTKFRGWLAVHAGSSRRCYDEIDEYPDGTPLPEADTFTYGAIVGMAKIVGCVRIEDYEDSLRPDHLDAALPWACGPWCWLIDDVVRFARPIACRGALGLWTVPPQIEIAAVAMIREEAICG